MPLTSFDILKLQHFTSTILAKAASGLRGAADDRRVNVKRVAYCLRRHLALCARYVSWQAEQSLFKYLGDRWWLQMHWHICNSLSIQGSEISDPVPKSKLTFVTQATEINNPKKWKRESQDELHILINGTNRSINHFLGAIHSSLSAAL